MGKWKVRGSQKGARRWRINTLINKYGGQCVLCNVNVVLTHSDPNQASVDHIIPKSKGGGEDFKNLQLLCRKCNNNKGDSVLDDDGEILEEEE